MVDEVQVNVAYLTNGLYDSESLDQSTVHSRTLANRTQLLQQQADNVYGMTEACRRLSTYSI